ncbi:MAG: hypothetical protein ACLFXM_14120 [Acidimicrobiia bacterium]
MAVLYVKNVPERLLRRVRATAVDRGETMRDLVLRALRNELERLGVEVPEEEGDET